MRERRARGMRKAAVELADVDAPLERAERFNNAPVVFVTAGARADWPGEEDDARWRLRHINGLTHARPEPVEGRARGSTSSPRANTRTRIHGSVTIWPQQVPRTRPTRCAIRGA